MSRSNFRVKLDLCEYYRDVRRYCWVFIDGSKMLQISQMKEHITKLFNVKEPFHLLLNETEYLPPHEDIRILKENETIAVAPGSGLVNETETSVNTTVIERTNEFIKTENTNSQRHKESQTIDVSPAKQEPVGRDNEEKVSNVALNETQTDISTADLTFHSMIDDDVISAAESKTMDSTVTDDSYVMDNYAPIPKKKRVRRRKPKRESPVIKIIAEEETRTKKPKIIDSCIISSGKHIRFDTVENEEIILTNMSYNQSRNGPSTSITSSCRELSNLLSLSQSSTPLTFTSRRIKEEIKTERVSDEDSKMCIPPAGTEQNGTCANGKTVNAYSNKELEAGVPMEFSMPRVKDIIAFKMLKLATDYTPQISDFIVGEVLSFCPKSSACTFHILHGVSEVQAPLGKFTLVQDEEERVMSDTITLNYSQLMEPRLLPKSDSG